MSKTTQVDMKYVRLDGGTQPRAEILESVINDYAERIEAGDAFPPVTIFFDGSEYWLADGFHRVKAYAKNGTTIIDADVRQGTRRDAVWFSYGANKDHGLRRTNADKRRSITGALTDDEWSQKSDVLIAEWCGVSAHFVCNVRNELRTVPGSSPNSTESGGRTKGKDGKWRKIKGKKPNHRTVAVDPSSEETDDNESYDDDGSSEQEYGSGRTETDDSSGPIDVEQDPLTRDAEDEAAVAAVCVELDRAMDRLIQKCPKSRIRSLWMEVGKWYRKLERDSNGSQN